jgi:signal transduction histidine kinase
MLIDNATKYTSQKGSISVAFDTDEKSVTIRVSDTGIGLGFWDKHRLFRHFFRANSAKLMDTNGLGLGLYTAKKIVDHHKGKLWAESEGLGKGATFCVRLPIKR